MAGLRPPRAGTGHNRPSHCEQLNLWPHPRLAQRVSGTAAVGRAALRPRRRRGLRARRPPPSSPSPSPCGCCTSGRCAARPYFSTLMGDARGYDQWAQRLAGGDWIGTDVFYQAPLYPYFLGLVYAVAGHDLMAVRLVQAVLGSLSAVLVGYAAARLVSRPGRRGGGRVAGALRAGDLLRRPDPEVGARRVLRRPRPGRDRRPRHWRARSEAPVVRRWAWRSAA